VFLNLSIRIDEGISGEYIFKDPCRFIYTIDYKFLFFLSFSISLINTPAIRLGSVEIVVFLITVSENFQLLLLTDLGSLEEYFFG
jgi:hypothetical protein